MSNHLSTKEEIEDILKTTFSPIFLQVIDDSAAHKKHPEAKLRPSAGHFKVVMQSTHFNNLNQVKRHRLVYQTLAHLMENEIHALSLNLYSTDETIQ